MTYMKIVDRTNCPEVAFATIPIGQVFIFENKVFMSVERFGIRNAVCLADGHVWGFDDTDSVVPIEAHLEITKRGF